MRAEEAAARRYLSSDRDGDATAIRLPAAIVAVLLSARGWRRDGPEQWVSPATGERSGRDEALACALLAEGDIEGFLEREPAE